MLHPHPTPSACDRAPRWAYCRENGAQNCASARGCRDGWRTRASFFSFPTASRWRELAWLQVSIIERYVPRSEHHSSARAYRQIVSASLQFLLSSVLRSQNLKTVVDTIRKRGSIPGMLKSFAALLFFASAVFAQANPTAYDALRTVGNQVNRDFVNRVVSVTGVDGNPQPSTWRILIDDPNARGGIREVQVTDGRITSNRVSSRQVTGTPQGATVNPARLNLDSSGAYEVASRTADSSHVPFALVSYTLRTNERGDATWIVTLQNQNRRPVGTIHIGANKGTVTRTEGMFAGAPMDAVVEDRREGDVEDEEHSGDNPTMRSVRHTFYRAREQAQETFKRVRHNFADYIRGND